jgi:hypothetical protein
MRPPRGLDVTLLLHYIKVYIHALDILSKPTTSQMDHLPLPSLTCSMHPPLTIPRLSVERYDGELFDEYLDRMERCGKCSPKNMSENMSEFMSFLQTWLFFGLLGTVFERDPNEIWREFSLEPTEPVKAVITTGRLSFYTRKYIPGFKPSHRKTVYCCLRIAYDTLNFVCNKPVKSSQHSKVLLSLSVLGEYLSTLIIWCFPDEMSELGPKLLRAWPAGILSRGHFLSQRMQDDGWCRRDITRHVQLLTTSGLYFVSHFGNPDAHVPHLNCTFTECKSAQISEDLYQTKHVCEYGDCGDIKADQGRLTFILQKNLIPLVPVMDNGTHNLHDQYLDLVESGSNIRYVAISHVWSEGLGNVSQNSLPRCQLLRLSRFVKDLYDLKATDRLHFWIDSICCPRGPKESRKLAIRKMRDTYVKADKVLVLDSWLSAQAIDGWSRYELVLKVFASKWNKRLWTLQEGALAKQLLFRFKNGSFTYPDRELRHDFSSLDFRLNLSCEDLEQVMIRTMSTVAYRALRGYQLPTAHEQRDRLRTFGIIRGLKDRDTSHEQDEALCLGALFNLDLKKIFDAQGEKRMATVWTLFPDIPSSLIFSFAPRLEQDGFRWAPRTFRWSTSAFFDDHVEYAPPPGRLHTSAEANGLVVEYPGVLFDCPRRPLSPTFYFKSGQWYRVSCNIFFETRRITFDMEAPDPIAEGRKIAVDWYRNIQSSEHVSVGLILNVDLPRIDHGLLDSRGILVSIFRKSGDLLFASFNSTVSVSIVEGIPSIGSNEDHIKVVEGANIRGSSQKWCLS